MRENRGIEEAQLHDRVARKDILDSDPSKLAHERAVLAAKIKEFNQNEAKEILDYLPEELVNTKFQAMVHRVSTETKIVSEIEDTIKLDNLLKNPEDRLFAVPVEFGLGKSDPVFRHGGADGLYDSINNKIKISEDIPTRKELWSMMIQSGTPEIIRILDHELIHYWEHVGMPLGEKVIDKFKNNKISKKIENFSYRTQRFIGNFPSRFYSMVSEMAMVIGNQAGKFEDNINEIIFSSQEDNRSKPQSLHKFGLNALSYLRKFSLKVAIESDKLEHNYRNSLDKKAEVTNKGTTDELRGEVIAQKAGRVFNQQENQNMSLIETLAKSYNYNDLADIDRIAITSLVVDRLRALGFNHKDIAIRLAKEKFNKDTASFPKLEQEIQDLATLEGLQLEDLDTITDIMRIEYDIENKKASIIAQEELKKLKADSSKNL